LDVTFYGVRGSTPCAGDSTARYGGNTASVVLSDHGRDPILFDLGTGLRYFGLDCPKGEPITAHALVTHLHWDHVQGLPFCKPLLSEGSTLCAYGPSHDGVGFGEAFDHLMRPPFFPVRAHELCSDIRFLTMEPGVPHEIAGAIVTAAHVPHTDTTFGYRVERDGVSVAYVSDHQQPIDDPEHVDAAVLELCHDVDVLIHDAQYTPDELAARADWGHCTLSYAVHVAAESAARCLVLFHHDPDHDDAALDVLTAAAAEEGARRGVPSVIAAAEGLHLSLPGASNAPQAVSAPLAGSA
jgi:phosphoribosyl 1,2-cyclic phosphodiesterase